MLELILVRHAKSSWKEPGLADRDRPLNKRGRRDGPPMAALLAEQVAMPDVVWCSAAKRTRATLEFLLDAGAVASISVAYRDDLYEADVAGLLAIIAQAPAHCRRLMLIGHNPGLHDLVEQLCGAGTVAKFPTLAVAVLRGDPGSWTEAGRAAWTLDALFNPKASLSR